MNRRDFLHTGAALAAAPALSFADDPTAGETLYNGIKVGPVASRYGAEGQGPSLYVTDPEGNVVELKGPPVG